MTDLYRVLRALASEPDLMLLVTILILLAGLLALVYVGTHHN